MTQEHDKHPPANGSMKPLACRKGAVLRRAAGGLLLFLFGGVLAASPCVTGPLDPALLREVPLEARIQSAPPDITALALRRNLANGVAIEPRPAPLDHPVAGALRRMLASLPQPLRVLAENHVAAVYLLQDNFGSARVEAARDGQGHLIGGCILLNLDALARTANAWASWREGSAFRTDDRYRLQVTLEAAETDSVENAARFLFLHELGHVVGMAAGVHGFWAAPETWPTTVHSPFTRLSWSTDGNRWLSPWHQRSPVLTLPRFYRFHAAPLPLSVAPLVYRALGETDWPSLYGSSDPYEDFAETFAIYVHTRLLHRPFRVDLYLGSERIGEFRSCLDTGRCPAKLALMARLLSADRER